MKKLTKALLLAAALTAPAFSVSAAEEAQAQPLTVEQMMEEMHHTMAMIKKEKDPIKREQLMQQHMEKMQQGRGEMKSGMGMMNKGGKGKKCKMGGKTAAQSTAAGDEVVAASAHAAHH